jgi:hypothetical protein
VNQSIARQEFFALLGTRAAVIFSLLIGGNASKFRVFSASAALLGGSSQRIWPAPHRGRFAIDLRKST